MPSPLKATALRGLGEPRGWFLVVDPGKRTGVAVVCVRENAAGSRYTRIITNVAALDELPGVLRHLQTGPGFEESWTFVVCEDYHLLGGRAMQQSGSDMPSSQGIGMCRTACEWTDTPLYLVPPNIKRAGHQALDAEGRAAYDDCRNDHERDVVDIAGYVLREMRRKP